MPTPAFSPTAVSRKRAVNLTLNEALVAQAKTYTGNLSATIEELLAGFVAEQTHARLAHQQQAIESADFWNAVSNAQGSFADEHSTL